MDIVKTITDHPYIIGGGIFVLGVLYLMSSGSGGQDQATDAGLAAAYYGAISADKQGQTALAMAQTQANAAVVINQQNTDAYVHTQNLWSENSLAQAELESDTAKYLAPFNLQSQYIGTLGQIAQLPGSYETVKSGSSGFFGLFGGSKESTVYKPNPNAAGAANALYSLNSGFMGFLPGH